MPHSENAVTAGVAAHAQLAAQRCGENQQSGLGNVAAAVERSARSGEHDWKGRAAAKQLKENALNAWWRLRQVQKRFAQRVGR